MAQLSRQDRVRVKRWLYRNDARLWALGTSRRQVCDVLNRHARIRIDCRQLRMLVAIAPCSRWRGLRRHIGVGQQSLSSKQWARVNQAVRAEAAGLRSADLNPCTLARALRDSHCLYVTPETVGQSLAYKALIRNGKACDAFDRREWFRLAYEETS